MPNQYFSVKQINPLERPMKEIMELNVRTFQNFSYFNPTDLLSAGKPEQILEKNIDIFIENGHKALDYVHTMFNIMEKNWLQMSDHISGSAKQMMSQAQMSARKTINETMDMGQRTSQKVASSVKKTVKKNIKQAQSVARKNINETTKAVKKTVKAASAVKKAVVTKSKPKTTAKTTKTAKIAKSSRVISTSIKKPVTKKTSSTLKTTPKTMSKTTPRIQATSKGSPISVKPVVKDISSSSTLINKDRPLM